MESRSQLSNDKSRKSVRIYLDNTSSGKEQLQVQQEIGIKRSDLRKKGTHGDNVVLKESRHSHEKRSKNTPQGSRASCLSKCEISSPNSRKTCHFSRRFDLATNIIAERILSTELEILQNKKGNETKKAAKAPRIPFRVNKLVAQRILEVNAKLSGKLQKPPSKSSARKTEIEVIKEPSNNVESSKSSEEAAKHRRSKCRSSRTPSLPRFHLSTKRSSSRMRMSNATVQASLRDPCESDDTQTDLLTPVRSITTQLTHKCLTHSKKTQTRMYKRNHIETSTIYIPGPAKYTNTISLYSASDQSTQFFEYMSRSDLYCLDWVNKHLFEVKMNLNNIIMDEKIRDISEIVTKSTLLSDVGSECWIR